MEFKKVVSSAIESYHYDDKKEVLTIKWKNGGEYAYRKVSPITVDKFLKAPSKRGFINEHVHGKHKLTKHLNRP